MVRRHPHVFGDERLSTAGEVAANWEEIKLKEKRGEAAAQCLKGSPGSFPPDPGAPAAGTRRKGRIRLEPPERVLPKLDEEIAEFKESLQQEDAGKIEEELGTCSSPS